MAEWTWIERLNNVFQTCLGIISGMSLMHLILLSVSGNDSSFLSMYEPLAVVLSLVFLIFTNLTVIFGFALSLIYREKAEMLAMRREQEKVSKMRMQQMITIVLTGMCGLALVALYWTPRSASFVVFRSTYK
jgi:hypothetical protein